MDVDKNKKVLFVMGMDSHLEKFLQEYVDPQNMSTLQIDGPVILQPYGDLMRAIIVAVYQNDVEEIFVVGTKEGPRNEEDKQDLFEKILFRNKDLKENMWTIDYLFRNSLSEFPNVTLKDWLEGSKTLTAGIQKSVQAIRHHPLMPSNVKVCGLLMDKKSGKLSEIAAS